MIFKYFFFIFTLLIFNYDVNSNEINADNCFDKKNAVEGWCVAGNGLDLLGERKIQGWLYSEFPDKKTTIYLNHKFKQLEVNGAFNRYMISMSIMRNFRNYKPDIPISRIQVGETKTKCNYSGFESSSIFGNTNSFNSAFSSHRFKGYSNTFGSMNCKTDEPDTMLVGGQIGHPEGVDQMTSNEIIDCKKMKFTSYVIDENEPRLYEWREIGGLLKPIANAFCSKYIMQPKSMITSFKNKEI
tara:strand:+ start:248 stop:973 length:726 start_codon:yes stop_codon:yes gene_type:complete